MIPDLADAEPSKEQQERGMAKWNIIHDRLFAIFRAVVPTVGLNQWELVHWTTCVTEQEMHQGLVEPERVICFDRFRVRLGYKMGRFGRNPLLLAPTLSLNCLCVQRD